MNTQKTHNRIWKALLLTVFIIGMTTIPCFADALPDTYAPYSGPGVSGWATEPSGAWKYYVNGASQKGWQTIGACWYYFDNRGVMQTGWQEIGGSQYYLSEATTDGHPKGSLYVNGLTPDGSWVDGNGAKTAKANPYGHTCVEVDLTNQMVYVYQGTNLVIAAPCVSGTRGVHDTAAGNWQINAKETCTYLTGPTWRAYVDYWMPFHGGQGLHDASWRDSFGGQIYVSGGSHGCVNLPYNAAAQLYSIAYVGMPVHVHY